MNCTWFLRIAAGCAVVLLARGTVHAADDKLDESAKVRFAPRNFYEDYLAPRMDSRLSGEAVAAGDYVNPAANPWTKDHATVLRIQKGAIRAGKKALKRYFLDSLRIDSWSIPLFEMKGAGALSGAAGDDARARLRFGISHLAPRAELTIPATYGRVGLSADTRGAVSASFESTSYTFRMDVAIDPREHTAMLTLGRRF